MNSSQEIESIAKKARKLSLKVTSSAKNAHIGSCLSCIDILSALYKFKQESLIKQNVVHEVIVSKGHAAAAVYGVLCAMGEIEESKLMDFCTNGNQLYGHVNHLAHPWIKLSTGSLGHGLPFGVGLALSKKLNLGEKLERIFVLMSDGELNEGTTWESALIANRFKLDNLVCVIDRNQIQSFGRTEDVMPLEPLAEKWRAFGWNCFAINGHDQLQIRDLLIDHEGPTVFLANTVKGKGVSFMEDSLDWHYKSPNSDQLAQALVEVDNQVFSDEGVR